jgi:hypothetical protein
VGSFTDSTENAVLNALMNAAALGAPATWYVAAFTASPSDSAAGTEVAAGGYARVSKTANTTNFPSASGGALSNGTAITFPTATGSQGTIVAVAGFSASSGGTAWWWDDFTGVSIATGDTLEIPVGDLDFTLD